MLSLKSTTIQVISVLFFALTQQSIHAQQEITLPELQSLAREHYPSLIQADLYRQIGITKASEVQTHLRPEIMATGLAQYQSEVTEFDLPSGEATFPKLKPDSYSLGVEVKEQLLDYGRVKTQKQIETGNAAAQAQQVEVDYVNIKAQINQLFANICLQQENKKIMLLRINELDAKRHKMESAVANGAALQSSFLVLQSEYLSTLQRIEEINSIMISGFKTLTLITGQQIDSTYTFILPDQQVGLQTQNIRPENEWFSVRHQTLQLQEDMIHKNHLPDFYAFGHGYVGRPGYNFLNNDIRPYGALGISMSWNLSSYYTTEHERTNLTLQQALIDAQKETFDLRLQGQLDDTFGEIKKLEKLIDLDRQIVEAKTA
ncbi:MAG TPA: hypothetical protein VJ508_19910, partial [Saprospiraceae bacterium]|nr:hypothetical protein [Saprospiraceae bacterium]